MTPQELSQQTITSDPQRRAIALIKAVQQASYTALDLYDVPLLPAMIDDGDEVPAETIDDRYISIIDRLQADLVHALLTTATDLAQLVDYIQFCARTLGTDGPQWQVLPAPAAPAMPESIGTNSDGAGERLDDVRIVWSIRPEVYFGRLAQKETL